MKALGTDKLQRLTVAYGVLRIAYAAGLLAAPARTARPWLGEGVDTAAGQVALRGLGGRDLALAAGSVAAVLRGRSARAWLAACAVGDAVDLVSTLTADDSQLPDNAKVGTVLAAGAFGVAGAALASRF